MFQRITLGMMALALGACDTHPLRNREMIGGDTTAEIAISIASMRQSLKGEKQAKFTQAVASLTLAMPDKHDTASVGDMTPQFARMVKGRNADQIIQLAELYRLSVPMDRR